MPTKPPERQPGSGEPKNESPFTRPVPSKPAPVEDPRVAKMRQHGIVLAPVMVIQEAHTAGLPLELACAVLMQESGGGHNEFGHDPTICVGWGTVTHAKYLVYLARRRLSGNRLMQGVGPMQLTWFAYQDEADQLGGCWQPRYNIRVGFRLLADHVRRYGLAAGIAAYNGSGPAAQAYAKAVMAQARTWKQWLA